MYFSFCTLFDLTTPNQLTPEINMRQRTPSHHFLTEVSLMRLGILSLVIFIYYVHRFIYNIIHSLLLCDLKVSLYANISNYFLMVALRLLIVFKCDNVISSRRISHILFYLAELAATYISKVGVYNT